MTEFKKKQAVSRMAISVYADPEFKSLVELAARRNECSISEFMRAVAEEWITNNLTLVDKS